MYHYTEARKPKKQKRPYTWLCSEQYKLSCSIYPAERAQSFREINAQVVAVCKDTVNIFGIKENALPTQKNWGKTIRGNLIFRYKIF